MSLPIYYNSDYTSGDYAFDTTRKSGLVAQRIENDLDVLLLDPSEHIAKTEALIRIVHDPNYADAVQNGQPLQLAESQGFIWDPKIYPMAVAHNAGLVAAAENVLTDDGKIAGSLSSGLHHARRGEGNGFCTFNGLAVAAKYAEQIGVERILVLDFDAHGGGGTRSLLDPKHVQIDVSTSAFDAWDPVNPFDRQIFAEEGSYMRAIEEALSSARVAGAFELVIYNAGMDPANSRVSAKALQTREAKVADWIRNRGYDAIFALAGGYTSNLTMDELVDLHTLTIEAFKPF